MNKIFLVFCCFVCFFTGNCAYTHTKIRDNKIYFTGDTTSVNFQITSACITQKQPFDKTTYTISPNGLKIKAGRKGSKKVVKCIRKVNNNHSIFKNNFTFAKNPGTLNFAIQGTLTINGVKFSNIILAQGHHYSTNNWWFGGKNCMHFFSYNNNSESVDCTSDNGKASWCFTHGVTWSLSRTSPYKIKLTKKLCSLEYG
ncbi:MAG: hypothetical protein OXC48_10920 [Endozoicomonadaceae bacterium]|nr:hypothetical protein [Endozoicomonadaceae bacterium]